MGVSREEAVGPPFDQKENGCVERDREQSRGERRSVQPNDVRVAAAFACIVLVHVFEHERLVSQEKTRRSSTRTRPAHVSAVAVLLVQSTSIAALLSELSSSSPGPSRTGRTYSLSLIRYDIAECRRQEPGTQQRPFTLYLRPRTYARREPQGPLRRMRPGIVQYCT